MTKINHENEFKIVQLRNATVIFKTLSLIAQSTQQRPLLTSSYEIYLVFGLASVQDIFCTEAGLML